MQLLIQNKNVVDPLVVPRRQSTFCFNVLWYVLNKADHAFTERMGQGVKGCAPVGIERQSCALAHLKIGSRCVPKNRERQPAQRFVLLLSSDELD